MLIAAFSPFLGSIAAIVAAIIGLAWLGGLAHNVLLGIGADLPSVAAAFAPLGFLLLWPLLPLRSPRRPLLLVALALVVAAAGLALWVRLDPIAASVPPWPPKG